MSRELGAWSNERRPQNRWTGFCYTKGTKRAKNGGGLASFAIFM
jgi:hypothetical protein